MQFAKPENAEAFDICYPTKEKLNPMAPTPPKESSSSTDRYRVGTLEKALTVLEELERSPSPLRIQQIVRTTGIERGTVFRLLCTLERHGYVERSPDKKYRTKFRRRHIRLGYFAPMTGTPFRCDVAESIQRGAKQNNVEVIFFDCRDHDLDANIQTAQAAIKTGVDLIMAFQPDESLARALAEQFNESRMPVIAIETPMPGAVFFGGNNYRAGVMAGEVLGRFAKQRWNGKFDRVVLIEPPAGNPSTGSRLTGALDGMRRILGAVTESQTVHLDGDAQHVDTSRAALAKVLSSLPPKTRLLVSAFNDPSAIGALQAIRAAGREKLTAVVGQNATVEGRIEMLRPDSALIASVAYFPERYGNRVIPLALSILNQERVPLAVYTDHLVLNRHNMSHYYGSGMTR